MIACAFTDFDLLMSIIHLCICRGEPVHYETHRRLCMMPTIDPCACDSSSLCADPPTPVCLPHAHTHLPPPLQAHTTYHIQQIWMPVKPCKHTLTPQLDTLNYTEGIPHEKHSLPVCCLLKPPIPTNQTCPRPSWHSINDPC